jgi:exonuclease III
MKIVSYNLRSGGKTGKDNHWQQLVQHFDADIICAQESRHPREYFSEAEFSKFKDCVHLSVGHGKWGSAILSKRHILEEVHLPQFKGWVVGAKISDLMIGGVSQETMVFSIHAPSPGPYLPGVNRILDEIATVCGKTPLIIAGDFNVTTAVRHVSELAMKNTAGERKLLTRLRKDFGLFNAWQTLHPNENLPQTLRWSRDPVPPFHCDGIFLNHNYLPHLVDAKVVGTGGWSTMSDHNPMLVTLAD